MQNYKFNNCFLCRTEISGLFFTAKPVQTRCTKMMYIWKRDKKSFSAVQCSDKEQASYSRLSSVLL